MGLASLDAALSGLRISQQQISVISNNVSNASTPGFSRKILPQSSQAINGETVGVLAGTISRNVDLNLSRDLWTQISAVGASDIRTKYLSGIEQFHGPPDAELSVASEISRLRDSFSVLSDAPEDNFLLAQTVEQAEKTANKINDLADLIATSRNDVQNDIQGTVERINQLLEQIADLNDQVQDNLNIRRTTAVTEDKRDEAIKELSSLIDISFFTRGDGVLVVQTNTGVELANNRANRLEFNGTPLSPTVYYPDSDIGIYVVDQDFQGTPSIDPQAINITESEPGGRLGGLLELRDSDFPRQQAQLDELAHKMALRFEAQGLRLFTDGTGSIPANTPPEINPSALPAGPFPVEYVGFSGQIRVNQAVLNDNTLIRTGTYGSTTIQTGSSEVIDRVIEYTFSNINFQEANNTDPATQVDLLNTGGDDLQTWLGLFSSSSINGTADLTQYSSVGTILAAGGDEVFGNIAALPPIPEEDRFTISFSDPATPGNDFSVDIDLRDARLGAALAIGNPDPVGGGTIDNAAEQLRALITDEINIQSPGNPYAATVGIGNNGQLTFNSRSDVAIAPAAAESINTTGFAFLGLSAQSVEASDPYFDIQLGNADPTRITIAPGDTSAQLISQLQAVPGLAVDTANFALDGVLRLRPGGPDYNNPDFGGSLTITGGPFTTDATASYGQPPAVTGTRTTIDGGVNIVSALFGTYTAGPPIGNNSAVADSLYQSETFTNNGVGSGVFVPFRTANLGPGFNIETGMEGASKLIDFAQKMVNSHAQQLIQIENRQADDESLRDILQTQLDSESGVNIDEELSNLIIYQTAFAASARVVTAVDELFQELLNAV